MTKRWALVALLVALSRSNVASAAPSSAAERKECIAAFDQGQRSKTEHHLMQAQTQLLACTKETCPGVLRADCADVLKSVEAALPSVVFAAKDGGKDVTDVKVWNGTDLVASSLDGKAISLDPGPYDFRFERGTDSTVVHIQLNETEKREVPAVFHPPKPPPARIVTQTIPMVRDKRSTAGYVVPGILAAGGVAAFVVAGIGKLTFDKDVNDFMAHCAPNCTEASRADLSNTLVHANVALGIGIGSVALAVITWFIFTPGYKPGPVPTTAALTW